MLKWRHFTSIALLVISSDIFAEDGSGHPLLSEDWVFRLGGQRADADVKAGLANPAIGEFPLIDLQGQGADTTVNSFWANVLWQAPERWSVGFSYFEAEADVQRITDREITFGDLLIPEGTGFAADFTTDFYVLNTFYDFYQADNRSAGIGVGVYALDLAVSAQAQVGGEPTGRRATADTLAPLPTLSAYYRHAFDDKWALMADVGYFSADIDKYDGDIFAADISIEYWFNENWGLGTGYTYVDLDLTVDERIFDQRYEVEYDSFFFYVTLGF